METWHAALDLTTGEIRTCTNSKYLNHWTKRTSRWNLAHGYGRSQWVFAHGDDWQNILAIKAAAYNMKGV